MDTDRETRPMGMLVEAWNGKIERAIESKRAWQAIADQCTAFYSADTGFLWKPQFQEKFFDTANGDASIQPKFRITIAKAFELVAIFGPLLYWRNPARQAEPRKPLVVSPEQQLRMMGVDPVMFGQMQQQVAQLQQQQQQLPPEAMQIAQFVQQVQQQLEQAQNSTQQDMQDRQSVAELMQTYLNWTPNELQLHRHAQMATTEALVKGLGILWQEPYRPPGSDRLMVGSFWGTSDDYLIDPDAESEDDAWWIAKKCVHPTWYVERLAKKPPGSLKKYASMESANAQAEQTTNQQANDARQRNDTNDQMVYWKIWSRAGIGSRQTAMAPEVKRSFSKTCGDYCHLLIAKNVPFPLNAPQGESLKGVSVDEMRKAFEWPTPHWRDGKWPCTRLEFYPVPRSPWPMAPLAPALGELVALNVFMAHLANRVWTSSRDFIAVKESAATAVEKVLAEGKDQALIRLPDIYESVQDVVQFLQQPLTNFDSWKMIEALMATFDKRTGLTETAYGLDAGGSKERTATGAQIKQQNMAVRPDHMASQVEQWMTDTALREALAVRWHLEGKDVADLMGPGAAKLWDHLLVNRPVERTIRDIDYRIEAGSARKPNRAREVANINEAMPFLMPVLQGREQTTGDFAPLNALLQKWGEAVEMDISGMLAQSPPPQEDPQQQQAQQQMQMEQEKHQLEQQKQQAEMQRDQQKQQIELQQDQQKQQVEQQQDQQKHVQEITQDQQKHVMELTQDEQQHVQELRQAQQKGQLDLKLAISKANAARTQANKTKGTAA